MKKTIQVLALCFLLYSCKPHAQQLSVQQIQSDFDSLHRALQEAHSGLYRYSSRAQMNTIFEKYRSQLNRPMTTQQFISVIAGLLPEMRDGHLRLEFDPVTAAKITDAKLFPLRLMTEGSKLMVLSNDTQDDHLILPGMEVVSINDHSSADLIQLFLSKIPDDGFIESGKRKRMERNFGMLYWMYADTADDFKVHVKDATGKILTATLHGILTADRENNRLANPVNSAINKSITAFADPDDNVTIRFIDKNIAVLHIKSFVSDSFYADIDNVFQAVHDRHPASLILDLRGNGGGADDYGAYLVAQFMNQPFRYFDHIRMNTINPSFTKFKPSSIENFRNGTVPDSTGGYLLTTAIHTGVGEQAPGKNPFPGQLIVLMNGGTFSTAADVTALLRHLTHAIFIGEESGGCYDGNTSGSNARFIFPNTKLMLNINMYDYYNAVKPATEKGRGTMPDYAVPFTVSDLLKGIDPQWEKAMDLAKGKK